MKTTTSIATGLTTLLAGGLLLTSVTTTVSAVWAPAAEAKFAMPQLKKVPIEKLLTNLEARLKAAKKADERAMLWFQIGRLHSMAYAFKTESADVDSSAGQPMMPFYGRPSSDYMQFDVTREASATQEASAKGHLKQATSYLRTATEIDPNLLPAKLGLAWCLDQAGHKAKALPIYREVFAKSYQQEKTKQGMRGMSVVAETADYLIPLLDSKTDAKEIADIEAKKQEIGEQFRTVTPIVVSLRAGMSRAELMAPIRVEFDLDGNGPKAYSSWPSKDAGWLVYDKDGSGSISSGLDLFGKSTFWIFWEHGYEALSALDADNNGSVEGSETAGLAIWQDLNNNAVSDPGEVRGLHACGIQSLSCTSEVGADGFHSNAEGVRFTDGKVGETVDWIVEPAR